MALFSKKEEITYDTILQRKPDLLFNKIDGEIVMLSIENNEYFGMDKVGSRIWELLEKPLSFKILIETLMSEFEVSSEQCTEDSLLFLKRLEEKKLIETLF
jgi:hypothetical protein